MRISGKVGRTENHVAVDVDVANKVWRLLQLDGSDKANRWLAYDSKQLKQYYGDDGKYIPSTPKFSTPKETLLTDGTFSPPTAEKPWIEIPKLEITIGNMHMFLKYPDYEPFLRVFNWRGFNASMTAEEQGEKDPADAWSRKPHDREIMRTAAFGNGRGDLTMCVRDNVGYQNGKAVESEERGMQTAEVVPFAIIAAMRQRYTETKLRATWGSRY